MNPEGQIVRVDLLPTFGYLKTVCEKVPGAAEETAGLPENQTGDPKAACSRTIQLGGQYRTRTYNLPHVKGTLCQLS